MDCSTSSSGIHHVRSISLPTRSHPSVVQIEEELGSLKKWEAGNSSSSMMDMDAVCGALMGLERLYTCVNDLIGLPQTQQTFSHEKHRRLVDELSDRSMVLLDVCGSLRDAVEQVKQHVRDVQSALRRRKGDLNMIMRINTSFFKTMKKDTKRNLSTLKQINNRVDESLDHQLLTVVRSLRDASSVSISVYRSLLPLMSSVLVAKPKATAWSKISNLIHKAANDESLNHLSVSGEDLEPHIEAIEKSLEGMFRSLIETRASLLKTCSH